MDSKKEKKNRKPPNLNPKLPITYKDTHAPQVNRLRVKPKKTPRKKELKILHEKKNASRFLTNARSKRDKYEKITKKKEKDRANS